jgi:hypothetical protein
MVVTESITNVHVYVGEFSGTIAGDIYCQRTQLEALPYASSYIPTVASTVTRVAETVSKTGLSSYINSQEGVLFVDLKDIKSQNFDSITINDNSGTDNNQVRLWFFNNTVTYQYNIGGVTSAQISSGSINLSNETKIACLWKLNEFKLFINGVKIGEDLSGNVLSLNTLNTLSFRRGNLFGIFYGKVKNLQVYPTALSDLELIALTTL